jgi:hypothetical protein
MNRFELTPSLVLMGIGAIALLWLIGKILGASFFFITAVVVVFLIVLIAYLVIRLHDEPILDKIKQCLRITGPEKEEDK